MNHSYCRHKQQHSDEQKIEEVAASYLIQILVIYQNEAYIW